MSVHLSFHKIDKTQANRPEPGALAQGGYRGARGYELRRDDFPRHSSNKPSMRARASEFCSAFELSEVVDAAGDVLAVLGVVAFVGVTAFAIFAAFFML